MKKWWTARVESVKRHPFRALLVTALSIVGVVLVISLWPKPAVECETTKGMGPALIHQSPPFLVRDQVIVAGPTQHKIKGVVEQVHADPELRLSLEPIRKCNFRHLARGKFSGQEDLKSRFFSFLRKARGVTMHLYHIKSSDGQPVSVKDVVDKINAVGNVDGVFADPNLLVGNSAASVCGNPDYSDGGSPFGRPTPLGKVTAEAAADFWKQWAFEQIGMDGSQPDMAASLPQGKDVIVGVFDTSPFPDPWEAVASGQEMPTEAEDIEPNSGAELLPIETLETIDWVNLIEVQPLTTVTEALTLTVLYPSIVNTLTVTLPNEITATESITIVDVSDHGLFVAGLVHATAPASELHLIKVLNEFGCGDLWTLNEALEYFVGEVVSQDPTNGAVINLSLGVYPPDVYTDLVCEESENTGDIIPVHSLCAVLSDAVEKGIVVVAAAGNDSDKEDIQPQQIPAAYGFVGGVQASAYERNRSCFSNEGNVAAPGGDGDRDHENGCGHKIEGCCENDATEDCSGACSEDIISLVLNSGEENVDLLSPYGYWRGTSFAAPLVSGEAALILEQNEGQILPPDVLEAIREGSCPAPDPDLLNGIINLPKTLFGTPCPTPPP